MTSGCKGQRVSGDTAGSRFLTSDFANEKGVGGANVERLLSVESSHGRGSTFCAKMSLGDFVLHVCEELPVNDVFSRVLYFLD